MNIVLRDRRRLTPYSQTLPHSSLLSKRFLKVIFACKGIPESSTQQCQGNTRSRGQTQNAIRIKKVNDVTGKINVRTLEKSKKWSRYAWPEQDSNPQSPHTHMVLCPLSQIGSYTMGVTITRGTRNEH